MTVSIIGWYGTETQGDIAILDGILAMLSKMDSLVDVRLGSLYKFYTERTLLLNSNVFKINSSNVNIKVFDVKDKSERLDNVKSSDLLLIGGGPLDNIREILLLEKCFVIARQKKIPSMIFGCGIDVLTDPTCISALKHISDMSRLILVRDKKSREKFLSLFDGIQDKIYTIQDPAILSITNFKIKKTVEIKKNGSVSINLRQYTQDEYEAPIYCGDKDFVDFIDCVASQYENVKLIPMHTFFCGGDDRYYLSKLKLGLNHKNVTVAHKPQTLYELYDVIKNSFACVGMRYHSIVMQTILNGNNLIFDYTDKNNGKIMGFLQDNDLTQKYENRVCHLQENTSFDLSSFTKRLKDGFCPVDVDYNSDFVVNMIKDVLK